MNSVNIALLLVINFCFNSEGKLLGLELGTPCPGGRCKLLTQCPSISDVKRTRPEICTFEGKIPVICCPDDELTTTSRTITTSRTTTTQAAKIETKKYNHPLFDADSEAGNKAEAQCIGFTNRLCKSVFSLMKAKRNVDYFRPVVMNGYSAKPKDLTFMALLGYGEESAKQWECGGTVISDSWILSAAHCNTHQRLGIARWIRLGELDYSTDDDDASPVDLEIIKREIHPQYDEKSSLYNDIALFQTKYTIIFNAYIRPICLRVVLPTNIDVMAAGWGTTGFGEPRSTDLQAVNLTLVPSQRCVEKYGRSKLLPNGIDRYTQVCAGAPGRDTCTGDSGGPLFQISDQYSCLWSQIGITSFGRRCGDEHPGVYTWILLYLDWIENIVWPGTDGYFDTIDIMI